MPLASGNDQCPYRILSCVPLLSCELMARNHKASMKGQKERGDTIGKPCQDMPLKEHATHNKVSAGVLFREEWRDRERAKVVLEWGQENK